MQPVNKKEPPTHIKSESVAFLLVVRNSVSEDFVVTYAVLVYPTAITGVSLNGINDTVFDFLDNAGVVGLSILRTRRTLVIPIKENNHSGNRLGRTVDPLSTIFEPLDAVHAACIFGYNPGVNIAALIGAPAIRTVKTVFLKKSFQISPHVITSPLFRKNMDSVQQSYIGIVSSYHIPCFFGDFHTIRIYPRTFSLPRSGSLSRRKILSMFRLITSYSLTCFFSLP